MRATRDASPDRDQPSPAAAVGARGDQGQMLLREARAGRPGALLALQRQAGNAAVASMLGSGSRRSLCRCPGRCTCGGDPELEEQRRLLARAPATTTGDTFSDDPLSDAGFGPNDATIRVKPGPVRTTMITSQPDLSCSYESRLLAKWGGATKMPLDKLTKDIVTAFTGCDIATVQIDVVPKSTGDDPRSDAIERADQIRGALIQWIGPHKFSEDRFTTGLLSASDDGAEVEVWLSGQNPYPSGGGGGGSTALSGQFVPAKPADKGMFDRGKNSQHLGVQGGAGDVSHYYTSPHGANDALHEWVTQVVAAYTIQRHANNDSGEEHQIFAQVQYSLTTQQFTVSFGGQESYVFALPANLQLSFWAQLTSGRNVTAGSSQESLSVGTQLVWQPADWLSFGVQGGVGPTVQSQGPSSIDRSGLLFFQIQK